MLLASWDFVYASLVVFSLLILKFGKNIALLYSFVKIYRQKMNQIINNFYMLIFIYVKHLIINLL